MGLSPSPMELMFLAVLALIVLGPNKLPDAARSVGKGFREMRDSFQGAVDGNGDDEDDRFHLDDLDDDEPDHEDEDEDDAEAVDPVVAESDSAVETGSAPQPVAEDDHQNDADSSVPSDSSSSTERE